MKVSGICGERARASGTTHLEKGLRKGAAGSSGHTAWEGHTTPKGVGVYLFLPCAGGSGPGCARPLPPMASRARGCHLLAHSGNRHTPLEDPGNGSLSRS